MATAFENYVNTEIPKRPSTSIPLSGNLDSSKLLMTTGVGLGVVPVDPTFGPQGSTGPQGNIGNQGVQGSTGPQGSTGAQGDIGFQGVQGTTGAQGNVGSQGSTGAQGNIGPQGSTGAQGPQGSTGAQGNIGPQGSTGAQGNIGPQGSTGAQGDIGPQGDVGSQGSTGAQGSTGIKGDIGFQGVQGIIGPQGFQGDVGSQGNTGAQGPTGVGDIGPQGVQGSVGNQGSTGPQGSGYSYEMQLPIFNSTASGQVLDVGFIREIDSVPAIDIIGGAAGQVGSISYEFLSRGSAPQSVTLKYKNTGTATVDARFYDTAGSDNVDSTGNTSGSMTDIVLTPSSGTWTLGGVMKAKLIANVNNGDIVYASRCIVHY